MNQVDLSAPSIRPFLKWPGGKYRLLPILHAHLPVCTHLIEPFVGAGALFLNANHRQITVNDVNTDLINLYRQIQTHGEQFIRQAKKLFCQKNNKSQIYYRLRKNFNETTDSAERASLFLYLNRHGYNGLCRYNLKGLYNVPFGAYCKPYFPQKELEYFHGRAQRVIFHCEDYALLLNKFLQRKNLSKMVFYCDPPYAPLSATANFTGYAAQRFTLEDQKRLALLAENLCNKGATVLISNHDTSFTREIYASATLKTLQVARTISCHTQRRNKVAELIACYLPD